MYEAITRNVKYVYLDIEKYSRVRSVEAQVEIIKILNEIVLESIQIVLKKDEDTIYLPTGDGICIALLNPNLPYDTHLLVSLTILQKIDEHNQKADNEMRRFAVRIGINENVDNIVKDINGKTNVTGAGINMAQRIMGLADGNQILIAQSVYETFKYREKYMKSFKHYQAIVKHGIRLNVYQLIGDYPGLDTEIPQEFLASDISEAPLDLFSAYYFAHAVKNRNFFLSLNRLTQDYHVAVVLLYFLAIDSVGVKQSTDVNPYVAKIFGKDRKTISEQYEHYGSINYWVCSEFSDFVEARLKKYHPFFEKAVKYVFVNKEGIEKLKREFPQIYEEFGFDVAEKFELS
jgi:class 3 adenylate cyclase